MTSTATIAEVGFLKGGKTKVDTQAVTRINELWHPTSPFIVIDVSARIGQRAAELLRLSAMADSTISPMDCIHLATAEFAKASHFHTWDEKLASRARKIGLLAASTIGPVPSTMLQFPPSGPSGTKSAEAAE